MKGLKLDNLFKKMENKPILCLGLVLGHVPSFFSCLGFAIMRLKLLNLS